MKQFLFILIAGLLPGLSLATDGDKTKYAVDVANSTIVWKGGKVVGGGHTGTVSLAEGALVMDADKLVGGEFVIDMTTLANTDLSGGGKAKLEGHLKSDDFFGVESHPKAMLKIKKVKAKGDMYHVTADVTIKGITHPVDFEVSVGGEGNSMKATSNITIDRAKYDVRYGSGSFFDDLGDKAISDEFTLDVELAFSQVQS